MSEDLLQDLHRDVMRAIVRNVSDTPLVLKGGTALMFAYNLPRFSEDLDFDSPTIAEHKIAAAISGDKPRTAARDLFDLAFMTGTHPDAFNSEQWKTLSHFLDNPQAVVERYKPAFADDLLLLDRDAEEIVLTLQANVEAHSSPRD